jgi:hypothetical protein
MDDDDRLAAKAHVRDQLAGDSLRPHELAVKGHLPALARAVDL